MTGKSYYEKLKSVLGCLQQIHSRHSGPACVCGGDMDNRDRMRTMMKQNVTEERTEQTDRPCFSALTSEAELFMFS